MSEEPSKFGLLDPKWQHLGASILLTILLPLLPLMLEKLITDQLSATSLLIAAAVYCCGLGMASGSVLVVTLGVLASVVLSVLYGVTSVQVSSKEAADVDYVRNIAWMCILFFGIAHAFDRYDMHVTRGRNFLDFRRIRE